MIRMLLLAVLVSLTLTTAAGAQTRFSPTRLSPAQVVALRAEQAAVRNSVPMDPKEFDKFLGVYRLMPSTLIWVTRDGPHFMVLTTGHPVYEYFPESPTKFFSNEQRQQLSFESDANGHVIGLVMDQVGMERWCPRLSKRAGKAIEATLKARIKAGAPSPGTEAALRHQIDAVEKGAFDTDAMTPDMGSLVGSQALAASERFAQLGTLKSLKFKYVTLNGYDLYDAVFERGHLSFMLSPLVDGKIQGFRYLNASDPVPE
jgi:hypothetical protein